MPSFTKIATAAALAVGLGVSISACSGGQSAEEACKIFSSADSSLASAVSSSTSDLIDDPDSAKASLDEAISSFESDVKDISNADVKEAVDELTDSLKSFSTAFGDAADTVADDPSAVDPAEIQDSAEKVQKAEDGVVSVCKG